MTTPGGPGWPSVTVCMLAYRSRGTSPAALRSVLDDGYPGELEVRVREQGGDEGERTDLREAARGDRRVSITSGPNLGFCGGHNLLLSEPFGDVVVLVNADASVRAGFLEHAVGPFEDPTVAAVQPLVVRNSDGRVDAAGLSVTRSRRTVVVGRGSDPGSLTAGEVWGVDGAVMVLRGEAIRSVMRPHGLLFPPEYGSYMEDVELAWRLRRLGWRAWFRPDAVADHHRGTAELADRYWARLWERRDRSLEAHVGGFVNWRLTRIRHDAGRPLWSDAFRWIPHELAAWLALAIATPGAVPMVLRRLRRGLGSATSTRRSMAAFPPGWFPER